MIRTGLVVLLLVVLCAACVENYKDIDASMPSAGMTFTKAYDTRHIAWGGGIQGFDFSDDGQCETMKRAAVLTVFSDDSKSKNVIAGKKVTVLAFSTLFRSGVVSCPQGLCTETVMCQNGVSFVPEQGHHYTVTQNAGVDSKICPIKIVDDATGSVPASVQHDFHGYCPEA